MSQIQIMAKMMDARDTCKRLPSWPIMIPALKQAIFARKRITEKDTLPAFLDLMKDAGGDPIRQMWLTAAVVEMIENE